MPSICLLTELNNINTPDPDQTGYWSLNTKPAGLSFPFDLLIDCGSGFVNTTFTSLPAIICSTSTHNPCVEFSGEYPGDYDFVYRQPAGSCAGNTSTLKVTVKQTPVVSITCQVTSCTYVGGIENNGSPGCVALQPCDNNTSPLATTYMTIAGNCGSGSFVAFEGNVCSNNNYRLKEDYKLTTAAGHTLMSYTGYIETIDISYDNGTGTVTHHTLDVSPTSVAALTCCGSCSGGTNNDLIWQSGLSKATYASTLLCTIKSAIATATGVPSTPSNQANYSLSVSTGGGASTLAVTVSFQCANVSSSPTVVNCVDGISNSCSTPSGINLCGNAFMINGNTQYTTNKWVGAKWNGTKGNLTYKVTSGGGSISFSHDPVEYGGMGLVVPFPTNCGCASLSLSGTDPIGTFDLTNSHFNTIIPLSEKCGIIINGDGGGSSVTCNSTQLTASPNCGTVIWSGNVTGPLDTNPTYTTATTGTVFVTIDCDGCHGSGSKLLPC